MFYVEALIFQQMTCSAKPWWASLLFCGY